MSDGPRDPQDLDPQDLDRQAERAGHGEDAAATSLARATAVMSAGTTLSRVTGFVRLAAMAWAIGGAESKLPDTYQLANTLPNIVYQLILGEILATIFVPVFVEYLTTRSREESWRLGSTIVSLAAIIGVAISAITVAAAPWLIKIYTFGVDDAATRAAQEQVGTFFLRLFMPQMVFYAVGSVLTGMLNAHRRFALPMFAPVLNNLIVTATFVVFRFVHGTDVPTLQGLTAGDKLLLGGGTTLGVVVMTLALVPGVRALPGRLRFRHLEWRHPAIRHVGNLAKYSLGYVVINQVGLWLVKMLANRVQGGVAAYDTAFVIYQLPYGIFAVSVMTALVPALSKHHVHNDVPAFRRDLSLGLRTTAFVVLPAAAGLVAIGRPIVRLLLERGIFSAESTALFADTLVYMAGGLAAYAAFQQIMRAFYSMQDTKTPWLVNIGVNAVNIATAVPLFAWLGVKGLGLSHALSYLFAVFAALWLIRKRLGGVDGARLLSSHLRILAGSALSAVGAWAAANAVERVVDVATFAGQLAQVGAGIAAALILYSLVVAALRLDEYRPLVGMVAGRFGRAKGDR